MGDQPKSPPPPLPRPGTHGEIRRRTPPQGYPVPLATPHEVSFEDTDVRSRRPTDDRVLTLERDHKAFHERLGMLEVTVGRIDERTKSSDEKLDKLVELDQAKRVAETKETVATRAEMRRTIIRLAGATMSGVGVLYVLLHAVGVLP